MDKLFTTLLVSLVILVNSITSSLDFNKSQVCILYINQFGLHISIYNYDENDSRYILCPIITPHSSPNCTTWTASFEQMVSTWSRCEVGGEFIRATRLGNKQLPHRIHLCILAHDSSGSLLPPRPSTPPGAIRELRCPSIWLSSIGFRVIGRRIEERGDEEGY